MKVAYLAVAAGVVIFASLLAASDYANTSLQFKSRGLQGIDFAQPSAEIAMDVCNPTSFPAGFDRLEFVASYEDSEFASMVFNDANIAPNSQTRVAGTLDVDGRAVVAAVLQSFADRLEDREVDQNQFRVHMSTDSRLLGFVPVSQSREMSAEEFSNLISGEQGFECAA